MNIKENRDVHYSTSVFTLQVAADSIDQDVQMKIRTADESTAPPINCEFGEVILSEVIQIEPMELDFKVPAVLSINHSVVEMPECSSIVIKCYDHGKKEWIILDPGIFNSTFYFDAYLLQPFAQIVNLFYIVTI